MKLLIPSLALAASFFFTSCQQEEAITEFTGRSLEYPMISGAYFDQTTTGTLTIKEKTNGSLQIALAMDGTMDGASHPVHLHRGSLMEDETVALYLSPLEDAGNHHSSSVTTLSMLEDETVTFEDFQQLDASIKVHFQETGEMRNVILGATNIGKNYQAKDVITLDKSITTCNNF